MAEFIEINILSDDCFICYDSHESGHVTFKCCNKRNIHKKCLFDIFLNYLNFQSSIILCPLCRQEISITDYFTLDECITSFTTNNSELYQQKLMSKFNAIITYNYVDYKHTLNIAKNIIPPKQMTTYGRCMSAFIIFILLIMFVIMFKVVYS